MEITLKHTTQLELFKNWIRCFIPVKGFREETEVPVLASLVLLYYTYMNNGKSVGDINFLLFHEDTKMSLRTKLGFSERSFNKTLGLLEEKGVIIDRQLSPSYIPKEFKITYNFESVVADV
jgi:hypothetical protein